MQVNSWLESLISVSQVDASKALRSLLQVNARPAGDVLAYEGDPLTMLSWVIDGQVKAHKEASDGRQVLIHTLKAPFAVSGYLSVRYRQPVTIVAATPVTEVTLSAAKYERWAQAFPHSAILLLEDAIQTVHRTWAAVTAQLADDLAFFKPETLSA